MKKNTRSLLLIGTLSILLTGCAGSPNNSKIDPYEKSNRAMFKFNRTLDKAIIKPLAQAYDLITPPPLQRGISNVFSNIGEIQTVANDVLQGKIKYALSDLWRFIINSTVGIGGLFDPASHLGLKKHYEDFGMTLASWGNSEQSPYLVLPLFGPSTTRAAFGRIPDYYSKPWPYIKNKKIGYIATATRLLNIRSKLLPAEKMIYDSFDPYIFVRNAYLQKRNKLIADNKKSYDEATTQKSSEQPAHHNYNSVSAEKKSTDNTVKNNSKATKKHPSKKNNNIYIDDATAALPIKK